MDNPRLDYLREKVRKLPLEPGVYLMRDQGGTIIYVGKAKALKNRVSSYFRSVETVSYTHLLAAAKAKNIPAGLGYCTAIFMGTWISCGFACR